MPPHFWRNTLWLVDLDLLSPFFLYENCVWSESFSASTTDGNAIRKILFS
jgi:hypothetical protein